MFTKLFWKDALERAISTAAQFALGVVGLSDEVFGVITQNATLPLIVYAAITGFVLSIIKALAATGLAGTDTASFTVDTKELK